MDNRYGKLASWVYHLDKPVGRSFGDIEHYRSRLNGCAGSILEPAVGNGRFLIPLLEEGFDIFGFDASETMLENCKHECAVRKLSPKLTLQAFDDFSYSDRFEAVVMPAGSFQLITSTEKALAALGRMYDHILPGGRIIFDIDNMKGVIEATASVRSWQPSEDDLLTLHSESPQNDYISQTSLYYLRYEHWRAGRLVDSEMDLFRLRWWGIDELKFALKSVGFKNVDITGGYEYGRAPRDSDSVITFEAQRPS
ncbi:MAG: class I SAM-dependent methyltransferase [Pseudomonas balearica]|nr:class I SAM-dependent methyltransferase [Stutzerimonas balearica]